MKKRKLHRSTLLIPAILVLALITMQCTPELIEWEAKSNEMVISEYVRNHEEDFGEFWKILDYTGIDNILNVRGPFTLLLPTDIALRDYYTLKGVSSFDELSVEVLSDMVYNHLFQGEISSGAIGQGSMLYQNALGDFVASEFTGIDILINKTAIIIKRDIYTANGVVHHIDHVLEPVVTSVYEQLETFGNFDIFLEGLDAAGLSDTLKLIEFPYGQRTARTRYTILAVPDSVYNNLNIFSVDQLIDKYSEGDVPLTNVNNGFFQYMEYHCLNGTYYFNDFEQRGIYQLISFNNYLKISVGKDFEINKSGDEYTGFIYELSNIPAKNGVVHSVDSLLEVEDTELETVTFQTTDFFDLQQGSFYLNHYQRFYDGQNTFENLKWDGEFLLYYLKPDHNLIDDDCINLNGHFWVEITTRKIRKGTYDISGFFFFGGADKSNALAVYVDDTYLGVIDLSEPAWGGPPIRFGTVTFTETKKHKIRLETISPGQCFWDYVRFTPHQE